MTEPAVQVHREDDVAVLELDRPPLNALSSGLLDEIGAAIAELEADLPGALVVVGNDRAFSAGADIAEFDGPKEAEHMAAAFARALGRLAAFPRVTVAAVNGFALGGGFELALACDLRILAVGAKVGLPEVQLGVIPGGGGTQRLTAIVGRQRALDLLLSGRHVVADEAKALGLCELVVPGQSLLDEAVTFARTYASGAVIAQGFIKEAVNASGTSIGFDTERRLFAEVFATEDAQRGIASFRESGPGKAEFHGR